MDGSLFLRTSPESGQRSKPRKKRLPITKNYWQVDPSILTAVIFIV